MTDNSIGLSLITKPCSMAGKTLLYICRKIGLGKVLLVCLGYSSLRLLDLYRKHRRSSLGAITYELIIRGSYDMFYPRIITKPGSHYAVVHNGLHGFNRCTAFHTHFTPALNIYNSKISLFSLLGYHVNCSFHVKRQSEDYVRLGVESFEISSQFHAPTMEFVFGQSAALGYMTEDEARVQIQAAPYVGCDLPLSEYEVLRLRTGKGAVNFGYLEFASKELTVQRSDIPIVGQALREECRVLNLEPAWVVPKTQEGDGDVTVTLLRDEYDVDLSAVKAAGKILPSPCDQESIVYVANKSAEAACVEDRIKKYVKTLEQTVPKKYERWANDFVQRLIPAHLVNSGCPDDEAVALDRQQRRSQRDGYEQVKDLPDNLRSDRDSTFLKNEVYPEAKAPRNIVNPGHAKRIYTSMIIYPFTSAIKSTSMHTVYGFGDADYVQSCFLKVENQDRGKGKFESDGTKMDANIGSFFRKLELSMLLRFYHSDHHERVKDIHAQQFADNVPKTKKGNRVELKWSRRSGEGGTSTFNTLSMTFTFYSWFRENGCSSEEAWTKLGVYGGDDGLTVAHYSEESLHRVADDLGLPLKIKHVGQYDAFSFLGMVKIPKLDLYAPDVVRFVSKIAYSHVKGVPVEQILYRKCEPYVRMYPNIPLVGNLCRAVLRILRSSSTWKVDPKYDELCRSHTGFVMAMLDGEQMPGPQNEEERMLLEHWIASALGISLGTLREVCSAYDRATNYSEFPQGYVKKDNLFLNCKYEALIRDLYIPGPEQLKLVSDLPSETKSAEQNLPRNAKKEKESSEEIPDAISTTSGGSAKSQVWKKAKPDRA